MLPFSTDEDFLYKRVTFTLFVAFSVSVFSQNNQLKMILRPKRHILGRHILFSFGPLFFLLPFTLNIFYRMNSGFKDLVYINGKSLFLALSLTPANDLTCSGRIFFPFSEVAGDHSPSLGKIKTQIKELQP